MIFRVGILLATGTTCGLGCVLAMELGKGQDYTSISNGDAYSCGLASAVELRWIGGHISTTYAFTMLGNG